MNSIVQESICEYYGLDDVGEIFDQEAEMLNDSVQDGFCTECGAVRCSVEPDASGYPCEECGENKVDSITMILLYSF